MVSKSLIVGMIQVLLAMWQLGYFSKSCSPNFSTILLTFGCRVFQGDDWQGQFGPMMWFLLSAFIFCVMGAGITWFSRGAAEAADKVLMLKFKLNKKVYPAKMYRYLMKKPLAAESYDQFKQDMRKIAWNEEGNPGRWTNGLLNLFVMDPQATLCAMYNIFSFVVPTNRCWPGRCYLHS